MSKHTFHYYAPITPTHFSVLLGQILRAIQEQSADDLTLLISSEGGDLNTGFTAYNFIRSLPFPVTVVNMGTVESIAAPIYLAGKNRFALKDSRFLLHSFNWGFQNTPYQHEYSKVIEIAKSLKFDVDRYASIFEERTQPTENRLNIRECLEGRAAILSASAAASYGICDKIIEPASAIAADAIHWWVNN